MQPYSDGEIDEAIERIAGDVARRFEVPEFHGPQMEALLEQVRSMEAARRAGDRAAATIIAQAVAPMLETYRPTNATSRAKAIVGEVVGDLLTETSPPAA